VSKTNRTREAVKGSKGDIHDNPSGWGVFLAIWHCILSVELIKNALPQAVFFWRVESNEGFSKVNFQNKHREMLNLKLKSNFRTLNDSKVKVKKKLYSYGTRIYCPRTLYQRSTDSAVAP